MFEHILNLFSKTSEHNESKSGDNSNSVNVQIVENSKDNHATNRVILIIIAVILVITFLWKVYKIHTKHVRRTVTRKSQDDLLNA